MAADMRIKTMILLQLMWRCGTAAVSVAAEAVGNSLSGGAAAAVMLQGRGCSCSCEDDTATAERAATDDRDGFRVTALSSGPTGLAFSKRTYTARVKMKILIKMKTKITGVHHSRSATIALTVGSKPHTPPPLVVTNCITHDDQIS
jgi:hypothetical protein